MRGGVEMGDAERERERDRGYRLMKSKVTSEKKLRKEGRIEGRW